MNQGNKYQTFTPHIPFNNSQQNRPQQLRTGFRPGNRGRYSMDSQKDQRQSYHDHKSRNSHHNGSEGRLPLDLIKKARNCNKHITEVLNKTCLHPDCAHNGALCDGCILEDIKHSTEHKNFLIDVDKYLENIDITFQEHKKYVLDNKLVNKDLLIFLEVEDRNVNDYIEHTKKQKRIIEEHSSSLIKCFIEMVQDKLTELKTIFDLQLDIFTKNYRNTSEKLRVWYQTLGVGVFSINVKKDKITDFDKFVREIKCQDSILKTIKSKGIQAPKKRPYDDEVLAEIYKSIEKVTQQFSNPVKLDTYREENQNSKTYLNFYPSYKTLMKDIEKSFEIFGKSLSPVDKFYEFEENNFSYFEKIFSNSEINIESDIFIDQRQKENIKAQPVVDNSLFTNKIWADNYYHLDCKNKMTAAFDPGSPYLIYFLFKNITPFMVDESINTSCETNQLNIDFMIPRNHASIITPTGRMFLIGGIDESKEVLDTMYELVYEDQTLVQKKSMSLKRHSHGVCMLTNDFIMVAGGVSSERRLLDSCEIYCLRDDKWHSLAKLNKPSQGFCLTSFNENYVYKFGGAPESCIERYNIKLNKWDLINIYFPISFKLNSECVQINTHQILIFGGMPDSEYFFVNISDGENGPYEYLTEPEPIKFPIQGDSMYFGSQKTVVTYNRRIYAYDSGKQRVVAYSSASGWKISEALSSD